MVSAMIGKISNLKCEKFMSVPFGSAQWSQPFPVFCQKTCCKIKRKELDMSTEIDRNMCQNQIEKKSVQGNNTIHPMFWRLKVVPSSVRLFLRYLVHGRIEVVWIDLHDDRGRSTNTRWWVPYTMDLSVFEEKKHHRYKRLLLITIWIYINFENIETEKLFLLMTWLRSQCKLSIQFSFIVFNFISASNELQN